MLQDAFLIFAPFLSQISLSDANAFNLYNPAIHVLVLFVQNDFGARIAHP